MRKFIYFISLFLASAILFCSCANNHDIVETTSSISTEADESNISEAHKIFTSVSLESKVTPLFWKASDADGSCIWLLGSIHIGEEDFYPLPSYITDAFIDSDALAVEVNIHDMDLSSSMEAMKVLLYSDSSKIYDHISADLYRNAKDILNSFGMYSTLYDIYQPVLWMSLIDAILYEQSGYSSDLGIDINMMDAAVNMDKEIIEIESMESQYTMLASFSPELQEYLLQISVDGYYEDRESLSALVEAWKSANEDELLAILFEEDTNSASIELLDEYNRAMSTDRNILMSDFAENALISNRELFICVGTAHMLGEDGIVNQLIDRGYTVEKIVS